MKEMAVAKTSKSNKNDKNRNPKPKPAAPVNVPQERKNMNEFNFVRVNKYGSALYRRGDSRGTIAMSKTLFAGDPPTTLKIDGVQFAEPGASRLPSPEKIAKLQAAAERAAKRAAKAQEKLDKVSKSLSAEPAAASV